MQETQSNSIVFEIQDPPRQIFIWLLTNNSYLHLSSDDLEFKDANIIFQQKRHQNLDFLTLHSHKYSFVYLSFHILSRKNLKVCLHYVITSARPKHETLSSATFRTPTKKTLASQFLKIKTNKNKLTFFCEFLSSGCGVWQFTCGSGDCIAGYDVCDGIPQCADGSDESSDNCPSKHRKNKFLLWRFS